MSMIPHRAKTAEEAVVQADAKDRIRTAMGMRASGGGLFLYGTVRLLGYGAWAPSLHASHRVSLAAGFTIVGALLFIIGHVLLGRAKRLAAANPITAGLEHFKP